MKFYYLDTKFTSGKYKGQTLEEVYEKDPEYIDSALKEDDNFLVTEEVIDELQAINPNYSFSDEAISRRDGKEKEFDKAADGGDDDFDDDMDDNFNDEDGFDLEEDFDIEDIDEDELEDLDDLYDDEEEDEFEEDYNDFDDFADDSSWDRF